MRGLCSRPAVLLCFLTQFHCIHAHFTVPLYRLSAVQRKQAARRSAKAALNNDFDGDAPGDDDDAVGTLANTHAVLFFLTEHLHVHDSFVIIITLHAICLYVFLRFKCTCTMLKCSTVRLPRRVFGW